MPSSTPSAPSTATCSATSPICAAIRRRSTIWRRTRSCARSAACTGSRGARPPALAAVDRPPRGDRQLPVRRQPAPAVRRTGLAAGRRADPAAGPARLLRTASRCWTCSPRCRTSAPGGVRPHPDGRSAVRGGRRGERPPRGHGPLPGWRAPGPRSRSCWPRPTQPGRAGGLNRARRPAPVARVRRRPQRPARGPRPGARRADEPAPDPPRPGRPCGDRPPPAHATGGRRRYIVQESRWGARRGTSCSSPCTTGRMARAAKFGTEATRGRAFARVLGGLAARPTGSGSPEPVPPGTHRGCAPDFWTG